MFIVKLNWTELMKLLESTKLVMKYADHKTIRMKTLDSLLVFINNQLLFKIRCTDN